MLTKNIAKSITLLDNLHKWFYCYFSDFHFYLCFVSYNNNNVFNRNAYAI